MKPINIRGLLVLFLIITLASLSCIRIVREPATGSTPLPTETFTPTPTTTITVPPYTPPPATSTSTPTYTPPPTTYTPIPAIIMLPDLTITMVGFNRPDPYYQGDAIIFGAEMANYGNADASNFRVDVYIDDLALYSGMYSVLAPGEKALEWMPSPWIAVAGRHSLTWIIDADYYVNESDEDNNALQRTFTVYH